MTQEDKQNQKCALGPVEYALLAPKRIQNSE